jgi:hypothetical protein
MIDATFEVQLTGLLREYAETGVRPIDRFTIAGETIARGRTMRGSRWSFGRANRPLRLLLIGVLIVALAAAVALVGSRLVAPPPHAYSNELVAAPDLSMPMSSPTLVTLADGRVLVIGDGGAFHRDVTALVYDPATGASVNTGPMVPPGQWVDSAVPLKDGRVLIHGDGIYQVFDPTTMRFAAVGPTITPRSGGSAALLLDGRVLIAGGFPVGWTAGDVPALRSAEILDPDTMTSSPTGSIATSTGGGPMVTLPDGRVFMATDPVDEIYDPATGTFGPASPTSAVGGGRPVLLPDGRVVLAGSTGMYSGGRVEVWDPVSRMSSVTYPPEPLTGATLLDDGRVFLIGMCRGRSAGWTGVFDPSTGGTISTPGTRACRPTSTRLADGRVLIVGGVEPAVATVEIFQ